MINRLRNRTRIYAYCVGFLLAFTYAPRLTAQPGFFNFNYNGPDTLSVGVDCNLSLQGNIPNPIVTSTIGATIITSMFDATASGFPFSQLFVAGETAHIFWFVEDNMGHSHTFEFFVAFKDNSPPMFDLTGVNDTIFLNSVVQVLPPPNIPISDNCSNFLSTYVETTKPDTCVAGSFTRTWTATDASGNTSTFTQTIIIAADVTPPTITFPPQNGAAPCTQLSTAYPAWLAAQMINFKAQDPSGIKSLTNNGPAVFPPGCKVPLTVVFKATDNCNFMISTTAVFTTSDTQGPVTVVAPKDTIGYCSVGGNHVTKLTQWLNSRAYSQVYDSCSAPISYSMKMNGNSVDSAAVVAAFWASFDNACGTQMIGSQMVNKVSAFVRVDFFATDACGNQSFVGQATYAAVDTLPPVLAGMNSTEQCGGGNDQSALQSWINAKGNATMNDDCSIPFWTNFSFLSSSGQSGTGSFNAGPYPNVVANSCDWYVDVTFNAGDECGNNTSIILRYQIIDTQPPVFTGLAPNITVYCPNPLPTVPAATITDNCDLSMDVSFTRVYEDSICDGSYTVLTTWQATDDCGNTSTITQNIFVQDTTKPVFTLIPNSKIFRCDTFALPPVPVLGVNINATDICSPVVSISTLTTSFQNPNPALCGHYSYEIRRTFTATDECGNTQTATQLISVIDNQPPVPGGILDTTALCSAMQPFPAPSPLSADACGSPVTGPSYINTDTIAGACTGDYTLRLNWISSDVCGNQVSFEQLVHVIDSVAPLLSNIPTNITVECNAIPAVPNTATFNGTDNCAAAVNINLLQTEIRNPDTTNCDHWTNYIIRREWTAADDCGNARTYTQEIQIEDTTPPTMIPPAALTLPNDTDDCGAQVQIPAPLSVTDICTFSSHSVLLRDTIPITGAVQSMPVDTIVFQFATPNLPPNQPATSAVALTIFVDQTDADAPTEYFNVFGENGVLLGITSTIAGNCVSTTKILSITANQFNQWTTDGVLTLILAPNLTGGNPINPTCPNSRVRVRVGYNYTKPQVPVTLQYALDGGPTQNFPPPSSTFLGVGNHNVVYTATDCAGNSSTASVQIVVNDVQPPAITAPADITTYISVGAIECEDTITLPFPVISENCQMSGNLKKSSLFQALTFIQDPDAPDLVPANVNLNISGLFPNAIAPGLLTIKFKGDNGDPREFFNIFHNATPVLSTDPLSSGVECQDTLIKTYVASPAQINAWSASGNALFQARANLNVGPAFDNDFINPCDPNLLPDNTDGISKIQATLEYSYAIVNFTITNANNMPVASGAVQGTNTNVSLEPGVYTVKYTTTDNAGLMGMTTYKLTVRDTIKPTAKCKSAHIIYVNPSGVNNYTLLPSELNDGSTDNCPGNLSYGLSQSTFTCTQAGNSFNVTLIVTDASGNTSTCSTALLVQNAAPVPTHNPICESDTLFLFANPPSNATYTYSWAGPNNFTSIQQNPILYNAQPNIQGTYTVTITGVTTCTASGAVTVNFANLITPSLSANGVAFCAGQNIVLATPGGFPNVSYLWYSDSMGVGTLLATTTSNTYTIVNPPPGQYHFYLKLKIGDCLTPSSLIVTINVYARPLAIVNNDSITICANDPLALGTMVSGPGLTYEWNGPNWGPVTAQNPTVTNSATVAHSGLYILKTRQNGCESIPTDTTVVLVKHTPLAPQILGTTMICTGDSILLKASGAGAPAPTVYQWMDPNNNTITTGTSDVLIVPNASSTLHCGNWRVRAGYNNCFSPWSQAFYLCPQTYPVITAAANNPICQDSTLFLTATNGGTTPVSSWTWTLPNNAVDTRQNPFFTPAQLGLYTVIGKTSNGCADTASVNVIGGMGPVITGMDINAPVCEDKVSSAFITPSFTSNNGPFSYAWTFNGLSKSSNLVLDFIPVKASDNGTYIFVVKDKFGCPSAPASAVLNVQAFIETPTMAIAPNPVCAGDSVTLSVTNSGLYGGGSIFHWIDPSGNDIMTNAPQLKLAANLVSQSGNYQVFVSQGVCQSAMSNSVSLVVNPIPPKPVATSNQPLCMGETLQLEVAATPGTTYTWSGPSGFGPPSSPNPTRPNVLLTDQGNYYVFVTINGCKSPIDTIFVDIMQIPKTPVLTPANPNPVCIEQTITAHIDVTLITQTLGAIYTWTHQDITDTIISTTSPVLNFVDLPPQYLTPGIHMFQVSAWKSDNINGDGCSSPFSSTVTVRFDTIPDNIAQTVDDHNACAANNIKLMASQPTGNITGVWERYAGPFPVSITNKDTSCTTFVGFATNTYTFTWSLSSGGCKNFSVDTLVIHVVPPESADAGPDMAICSGANVSLNAKQGQYSSGHWSQMGQIGVTIADPFEPMSPVTGLNPGNRYVFVWTLEDIGCGAKSDTVLIDYQTTNSSISGPAVLCTQSNCAQLTAHGIQSWEYGIWSSATGLLNFNPPDNPNTTVCGLVPGDNIIYWTINGGFCGPLSRDTFVVNYQIFPKANPDMVPVEFGTPTTFEVLSNDLLPLDPPEVTIIVPPANGMIVGNPSNGTFVYRPNSGFTGTDAMIYRICNTYCGPSAACSTATVTFTVGAAGICEIPSIITPNNDGLNDAFIVPAECYFFGEGEAINLEVTIFNQWGDYVYHNPSFNLNVDSWDGKYNGSDLPVGTYYYVIKFDNGEKPKAGFLLLQR